jgi:cytochrome c oxidase cbb3-type subunit 3
MVRVEVCRVIALRAVTAAALVLAGAWQVTSSARQPPAPAQGRGGGGQSPGQGRGARGGGGAGGGEGTREFLGLGRAPDPELAARGEKLYVASCAFCHGPEAKGAEGPSLVRSEVVLHDNAGEVIGPVLLSGRPSAGMPAMSSLTPDQIAGIAEFLHLQVEKAANRGLYGTVFSNRNILTGDPKAGEAYFNGAGGCKNCHSATGDLAHVASKYQAVNLQNRWLWPGAGGRGGGGRGGPGGDQVKATIRLPSGETVAGTVKRLDDFDVTIIDASGNYHSWPRDGLTVEIPDPLATHRQLLDKYSDADVHNVTAYLATFK